MTLNKMSFTKEYPASPITLLHTTRRHMGTPLWLPWQKPWTQTAVQAFLSKVSCLVSRPYFLYIEFEKMEEMIPKELSGSRIL